MKLHGQFGRHTDDKKLGKSWNCLRNWSLKLVVSSTGACHSRFIIMMSQMNVDYVEHIWKMLCTEKVCLNVQWALYRKVWVKVCERWYKHKVESVIQNDIVNILWNVCIQVDRQTEHQRSVIVVMERLYVRTYELTTDVQ